MKKVFLLIVLLLAGCTSPKDNNYMRKISMTLPRGYTVVEYLDNPDDNYSRWYIIEFRGNKYLFFDCGEASMMLPYEDKR